MKRIPFLAILVVFTMAMLSIAQTNRPSFEVASIKPNSSGQRGGAVDAAGNRFVATNVTLLTLLHFAYRPLDRTPFLNDQIVGLPGWAMADRFDIQAKAEGGGRMGEDQIQRLLQELLAERFALKLHYETRNLPVYELVVSKAGKMHPATDQTPATVTRQQPPSGVINDASLPPRGTGRMKMTDSGVIVVATAVPIATLIGMLQGQFDRAILNKTGLNGLFDIRLEFARESTTPAPIQQNAGIPTLSTGATVYAAIEEQLGLKLRAVKAALPLLVVDSLEKPTPN